MSGGTTFAEGRDQLRDVLRGLADFADERGSVELADAARALDKKLVENRFNVVVLGEFKRGKTTFVNALLGAPILPAAVVPLTSIVTAVAWGEEVRAQVQFLDGREMQVSPGDLAAYVTERENPGNHLGVRRASLSYPSEDLRDGVYLIDTPGVGSVFGHNTESARQFLPEADVAIFLTSADPPISESERAFLHEVRAEAARMFFVLNKSDYLSEVDLAEALAFTKQVLEEALGREVAVHTMSARLALEAQLAGDHAALAASGLDAFERDFRAFLLREKGRTILTAAAGRAARLAADEHNSIDVEERAVALSERDLSRAKEQMEEVFAQAQTAREDVRTLLRAEAGKLARLVDGDLEELRRCEEQRLFAVAREFLASHEDPRTAGGELDAALRQALLGDIERWRMQEDRRVGEAFGSATARFVADADRIARETVQLCGQILGIDLAAAGRAAELSRESRFTYSFFEVPTILESILPDVRRFLPRAAARRLLERDIEAKIPPLVDKHCGRLRYDFSQRLEGSRRELEKAIDERLGATIASLRDGLERSERDRERGAEAVRATGERARSWRDRLDRLRSAFEAMTCEGRT
jgi:predicted GTPase